MTPDFKEQCLIHINNEKTKNDKLKFIDKLLKFYSDYKIIILKELDEIKNELEEEKDSRHDLPLSVTYRFEEKCFEEIQKAKAIEGQKIDELIDWLLEKRYEIQ